MDPGDRRDKERAFTLLVRLKRLRLGRAWNGLLVALGGAVSLAAALMLTLEAYWRALEPNKTFMCDVNEKLSCSVVADSWQAQLLSLPEGPVPNAVLGVVAFSVITTLGVVYACRFKAPAWFDWCFRIGVLACLIFSTWLLQQSMFVIKAMCPWCLTMDVGMILATIGMTRLWGASKGDGNNHESRFFRFTGDLSSLLVEVLVIVAFGLGIFFYYMF